jgi:peptidoglycan/xylan/chitin deacetylase (PgdA/CDA1 family)
MTVGRKSIPSMYLGINRITVALNATPLYSAVSMPPVLTPDDKKKGSTRLLLNDPDLITKHGDTILPLIDSSRYSQLLPDGTLLHHIPDRDAPQLNFHLTCNQSDFAHLYHALEISVLGDVPGAFTIGLRDWLDPCETDWAACPLASFVRAERYAVPPAGNRTVFRVPLAHFTNRLSARIRGIALLGFKAHPAALRVERVRLTASPPPPGWAAPLPEALAPVDFFCRRPGVIALGFDDGADALMSHALDQLRAARVPATFFQIGRRVGRSPARLAFARRALREGHAIEHHAWRHADATELPPAALRGDLDRALAQHRRLRLEPRRLRPPRGRTDAPLLAELARRGMTAVMWSFSLADTGGATATRAAIWAAFARAMARFRPDRHGLLSLQHFALNASLDLLPRMADAARAAGWRFVTLEECLAGPPGPPEAGPISAPDPRDPAGGLRPGPHSDAVARRAT